MTVLTVIDCNGCDSCSRCHHSNDCAFSVDLDGCDKCDKCDECFNCNNCNNCYDCYDCIDCSKCHKSYFCYGFTDRKNKVDFKPIIINDIHQTVLARVKWQKETTGITPQKITNCRAGWVVALAGEPGRELEKITSTKFAAIQIYKASSKHK